jgi:flagellar motility protein MotE (MotC chaperone)
MMRERLPRLRLLPVILGLAAVLLGVRVNALFAGLAGDPPVQLLGDPASAAEDKPAAAATPVTLPTPPPAAAAAPATTLAPAPPASDAAKDDIKDLTEFSASELSLLQSLRKRREELQVREDALVQRERMLKAFELRINDKIAELNTIKDGIEKTRAAMLDQAKVFEKSQDDRIQTLINVYEKMKPKDAARIFDNLDLKILMDVVRGMKEAKLAPILAEMNAEKATQVTTRMGEKLDIPAVASTAPATPGQDLPTATLDSIASEQPQGEAN